MKKLSKRMLSLILSAVMVFTTVPFTMLTASADEPRDHYLFAYFTGNSQEGQKIRFAVSEDGLKYSALNNNDAIITPTQTAANNSSGYCRDPYIQLGQDGNYYIIATDMDASGNGIHSSWAGDTCIYVWRSLADDLTNWTQITDFDVSAVGAFVDSSGNPLSTSATVDVDGTTFDLADTFRAWAPQFIWDSSVNKYMVYWANYMEKDNTKHWDNPILYSYTTDFQTFTEPQVLFHRSGTGAIDGDIMYNSSTGTYHMYYKREGDNNSIYQVTSNSLTGPYSNDHVAYTKDTGLEGPNSFMMDGKMYTFVDAYGAGYFAAYESTDMETFTELDSSRIRINQLSPRHGSVVAISQSTYNTLVTRYGLANESDILYNFDQDISMDKDNNGYQAFTDSCRHTFDVQRWGWGSAVARTVTRSLSLLDSNVYINDPGVRTIMASKDWTLSVDASVAAVKTSPMIALTSGTDSEHTQDWFRLMANGELYVYDGSSLVKKTTLTIIEGVEYTYAITYNGNTFSVYQDGNQVYSEEIGNVINYSNTVATSYLALGRTDTCTTSAFFGTYCNLRVREGAISASQAAGEVDLASERIFTYNNGTSTVDGRSNVTSCGSGITNEKYNGARGSSYTISAYVNIGTDKNGGAALFEFGNGGTDGATKQYLTLMEDGTIYFCWGDGTQHRYININGTSPFSANTWHLVQINVVPLGQCYVIRMWVDGVDNVWGNSDRGGNYHPADAGENCYGYEYSPNNLLRQTNLPLRLGTSNAHWGHDASYIDDLRVYTKAMVPSVLKARYESDYAAEQAGDSDDPIAANTALDSAISLFEARVTQMATYGYSKLYKNITPAYTAYKAAVAAKANGSASDKETARVALVTALNGMTRFTKYTANAVPSGSNFNVANTSTETYYRNIIYTEGANSGAHSFTSDVSGVIYDSWGAVLKYGTYAYLYYPNAVIMYDGENTPVVPVVAGFSNPDGRYSVNIIYLDENVGNFGLKQDHWYGKTTASSLEWPGNNSSIITIDHNNTTEYDDAWTPSGDDNNKYYIYKNGLEYTATPSTAYTCVSSTTWDVMSQYGAVNKKHTGVSITNSVPDIDIIDYARLLTALSSAANSSTNKGYLGDLQSKYKAGGLEGLFEAFDSATTLNPNTGSTYFNHSYDYAGVGVYAGRPEPMDLAARQCGEDIDASVALLGSISITTDAANFAELCNAIDAYEETMRTMTGVHINLLDAYKKYLVAIEYKDAYEFGGRRNFESPTLAKAAQNLREATANMTAYSAPAADVSVASADGVIKYPNDNIGISSSYYQNIVYWGTVPGSMTYNSSNKSSPPTNFSLAIQKNSATAAVTHPVTVLLYDGESGHTPKMPVFGAGHRTTSKDRYIWYLYPSESTSSQTKHSAFELDGEWNGIYSDKGRSSTLMEWTYNYTNGDKHSNKTNSLNTGSAFEGFQSQGFYYSNAMANTMSYKPINSGAGNTTSYYNKYLLPWTTEIGSDWKQVSNANDIAYGTSTTPIYVINYKPLKEKINSISPNLTAGSYSVDNYKEGGLATWLEQLDSLTNIDPNQYEAGSHPYGYKYNDSSYSYDNKTGTEAAVKKCADDIKALLGENGQGGSASGMSNTPTGTADTQTTANGDYTALKDAINEAKTAPKDQGCITTETWQAYLSAVQDAKDAMAAIANTDTSNTVTGKEGYTGTTIAGLAEDVHEAIIALYDIANSRHPLIFSYQEPGTHDGYFQCYRNNGHILHYDEDTHETSTVTQVDMEAYDEASVLYSTLDLTKFNATGRAIVAEGKAAFDDVKTEPSVAGQSPADYVDQGIRSLLESVNTAPGTGNANVNTFDVTFKVNKDGEDVYTNVSEGLTYGQAVTLNAADYTALGDNTCYKWVVGTNQITAERNTLTIYIQSDITVTAYYETPVAEPTEEDVTVTIYSNLFHPLHVLNLTTASTIKLTNKNTFEVDVDGNSGTTGDIKSYVAPDSYMYKITGWKVHGGSDLTLNTTYEIGDILPREGCTSFTLDPIIQNQFGDDAVYDITLDGSTVENDVPINSTRTVTTSVANAYAIVIHDGDKYIPVAYVKSGESTVSYKFDVIYDMEFFTLTKVNTAEEGEDPVYEYRIGNTTITDFTFLFYLKNKLPMMYSFAAPSYNPDEVESGHYSKWANNAAFTVSDAVTITECGTLFSRDETVTKDDMVLENVESDARVYKKINTDRDPVSNQYYYSFPSNKEMVVIYRAYVKYTYTYNGETYNAVSYSDLTLAYFNQDIPE